MKRVAQTDEIYEEPVDELREDPTGQSQGIRWDPDEPEDSDEELPSQPRGLHNGEPTFQDEEMEFSRGNWGEAAVMASPDLAEYLGQFDLTDFAKIAMCRTYASYLAALSRPAVRGPYKKNKSSKE